MYRLADSEGRIVENKRKEVLCVFSDSRVSAGLGKCFFEGGF